MIDNDLMLALPYPIVLLQREFQGEKIKVEANRYVGWDADEEESEQDATETDDDRQPYVSLVVNIYKDGQDLNFRCHLYAEDFEIKSMSMKRPEDSDFKKAYNEPRFSSLFFFMGNLELEHQQATEDSITLKFTGLFYLIRYQEQIHWTIKYIDFQPTVTCESSRPVAGRSPGGC